jgi:hypothetical protein
MVIGEYVSDPENKLKAWWRCGNSKRLPRFQLIFKMPAS